VDRVIRELERWVAAGIPSASIAIRVDGRLELDHTVGSACLDPTEPAAPHLPYDLASLTKALAASTVAAALIESGRLSLTDPVRRWIPEAHPELVVGHLLDHTGGFPAWAPLHERVPREDWGTDRARDAIVELACGAATDPPGVREVYTDLGFLALLRVVEAVGGARLDALFAPWAGDELRWGWPGAAATERRPDRGLVRGEVHDPLAFAMGGVSSHAGLFGTARAVAALADAVADAAAGRRGDVPGRILGLRWDQPSLGTHRGGWDTPTPGKSTGSRWPRDGVGHLGYTGTSVWVARERRVVVALLTNRVHPDDRKDAIQSARPAVHEAVAEALGW
jgi:CubicO group peptidase (beta-lactamase class C family)